MKFYGVTARFAPEIRQFKAKNKRLCVYLSTRNWRIPGVNRAVTIFFCLGYVDECFHMPGRSGSVAALLVAERRKTLVHIILK